MPACRTSHLGPLGAARVSDNDGSPRLALHRGLGARRGLRFPLLFRSFLGPGPCLLFASCRVRLAQGSGTHESNRPGRRGDLLDACTSEPDLGRDRLPLASSGTTSTKCNLRLAEMSRLWCEEPGTRPGNRSAERPPAVVPDQVAGSGAQVGTAVNLPRHAALCLANLDLVLPRCQHHLAQRPGTLCALQLLSPQMQASKGPVTTACRCVRLLRNGSDARVPAAARRGQSSVARPRP